MTSIPTRCVRSPRTKLVTILLLALTLELLVPARPEAFKIDTHVWVAQEILNDAQDGFVRVRLGETGRIVALPLTAAVTRALRTAPEYFRMGSIGPDAYPDVFLGQTIIHPSVSHGWGTAEWLRHLNQPGLSDQQRAFTLGYLVHAAGDVFAHTYVNRYAGDIFDIQRNETASLRHVRLESFISNFTPLLRDRSRNVLGRASATLRIRGGDLAIPVEFIRDNLYFNRTVVDEVERSGKAAYIPLIFNLRNNLDDALKKGGPVDNLEVLAIQITTYLTSDGYVKLSEDDARVVREWSEKIHNLGDCSEKCTQFVHDVETALYKLHLVETDVAKRVFGETDSALASLADLKRQIDTKADEIKNEKKRIDEMRDTVVEEYIIDDGCKRCGDIPTPVERKACEETCKVVKGTREVANRIKGQARDALQGIEGALRNLEQDHPKRVKALHDSMIKAMDGVNDARKKKLELNELALEFFRRNSASSPVRRILENWRGDVDTAMSAFVVANGTSMVNTVTEGVSEPLKPYKEWFDCYGKGLVGVPILITKGVCIVRAGIEDARKTIHDIEDTISKVTPITEELQRVKRRIESQVNDLKDDLISQGTDAIGIELGKLANINYLLWKQTFESPTGAKELNEEFATDRSGRGMLAIPDIAARVTAELHPTADGAFDPQRFAAAANAVTLGKIALLDSGSLKELARLAGISNSIFGEYLYSGDARYADNVLYGFAKSIDGNHQWHRLAPPNPRVAGYDADEFAQRRSDPDKGFTYVDDSCEPVRGMRMWIDPLARPAMFERLFVGPLSPGVDLPSALPGSFAPLLHKDYPNTVTTAKPWGLDGAELPMAQMTQVTEISGRGKKGLRVELLRGSTPLGSGDVDETGHWRFNASLSLTRSEWLRLSYSNKRGKVLGAVSTTYCQAEPGPDGTPKSLQAYVTVVESDSLWSIAELMTGNGRNYFLLRDKNKHLIENQNRIFPGQILLLPRENEWKYSEGQR